MDEDLCVFALVADASRQAEASRPQPQASRAEREASRRAVVPDAELAGLVAVAAAKASVVQRSSEHTRMAREGRKRKYEQQRLEKSEAKRAHVENKLSILSDKAHGDRRAAFVVQAPSRREGFSHRQ